ncbi:hypothetical protein FVE85_9148 [Porphyridium purpureum]|uniref:Uncharacterized protein n=1 Tax=Porphyridium purpureum TaxID=35688 RepID=A0A5J4YNI6_PORPP|nr:hypothetical protein FVE85_9148 [Porphyridium purpureum]|eukprot:POR5696..scf222_8
MCPHCMESKMQALDVRIIVTIAAPTSRCLLLEMRSCLKREFAEVIFFPMALKRVFLFFHLAIWEASNESESIRSW